MQNTELTIQEISAGGTSRGGNIYEAAQKYGFDADKIVDFSSNVNPLGPSPQALRAAKRTVSRIRFFPDPEMTELRTAVARYFGIKPEHVMCGGGENSLIHLIARVFKPRRVLVPAPSYAEYVTAAAESGAEITTLPLGEHNGFRIDAVEMAFALKNADMAFLCNPNDPTGQIIPKTEMMEIMKYAIERGVKLVVDEAFMDFVEQESIVKETVQTSNIICLRTFSKFFGMPGLRVGYAVSDETTIGSLRERQEPWDVSIPAEQAAMAALDDWSFVKKTRRVIARERTRLVSALRLLPGVETFPCSANFILVKVSSMDALTLRDKLGRQGMLIHDCSSFPGLDSRYVRISVRTWWQNRQLIKAMRKLLIP